MSTETTISAGANPELANKLVADALILAEQEAAAEAIEPSITVPLDNTVVLPGGLFDPFEGTITNVEIRELTGSDEEAISKINDQGKSLLTILERATVKIGDQPATKELLDVLLAGDREMILLGIRKVTFGPQVTLGPGECPFCDVEQTFHIDLETDVPVKKLEGGEREFSVNCKAGTVLVGLPTGAAQKALVSATNKTSAELDTLLLKSCIISINGNAVITLDTVKSLSIKDRRDILKVIVDHNPGPQLSEVTKSCQSCGQEVPLPLTLADLFRE